MSLPEYLSGLALMAVAVVAAALTAHRLRRALLPGWAGPAGVLVDAVAALGLVVITTELLGLLGLIRAWTLVPVLALIALLAWRLLPLPDGSGPDPRIAPAAPPVPGGLWPLAAVAAVTFLLVTQWGSFVGQNLDHGITNFDSVWYHLPYAAEIARSGSVTWFPHTETVFNNWFYPQNSELIHAVTITLTGREFLALFLNLGWLGLALLAGWTAGRPSGRPHLTLIGVAVVLSAHTLVVREPGTAKNDIVVIALLLAGVAILLNRESYRKADRPGTGPGWALAAAALAIGLAAGTKVTALAPAAGITLAVVASTPAAARLRALAVWGAGLAAGGGWWYLRNLVATGNPIPQLDRFGLPSPERMQQARPDHVVAEYLGDGAVWREYFLPGLNQAFGRLWPVLLAGTLAGLVALVIRGRGRLPRLLAFAALFGLAAYLFTPLSAAGPTGQPTAFSINLRFLAPSLAFGLMLVPLLPAFDAGRPARTGLGLLLGLVFLATWSRHPPGSTPGTAFGLLVALSGAGLVALAGYRRYRRTRGRGAGAALPAAMLGCVLLLLAGWPLQQRYFQNRYADFEPDAGLASVYRWASRTHDSRIGLAGTTAGFRAFGFYGPDLSNRVIYLGAPGPAGGFHAIGSCRPFVEAVNAARLQYLVTSPYLDFLDPERPERSPELGWIRGDPALAPVVTGGPVRVWRVSGPLDPERCLRPGVGHDGIPGRPAP